MQTPFQPKGDHARWLDIYDHLVTVEVGETVSYQQLLEWAGYDVREDRSPFYRAQQELLHVHKRAMRNRRGVGYDIVDAAGHEGIAKSHGKKARRQTTKAKAVIINTDLNGLTPETAARFAALETQYAGVEGMLRRIARQQEQQGRAIENLRETSRQTKATTAELAERVERLERATALLPETSDVG